jgi:hypothetical protein
MAALNIRFCPRFGGCHPYLATALCRGRRRITAAEVFLWKVVSETVDRTYTFGLDKRYIMASRSSEVGRSPRQTTRQADPQVRATATSCIRRYAARDRPHRSGAARSRACAGRRAPAPELPWSSKTNELWCAQGADAAIAHFYHPCAEEICAQVDLVGPETSVRHGSSFQPDT